MNPEYNLSLDALVRAINLNKGVGHGLFLGAGASISSGVKSAYDCIWEWKREIFLSNNPGLELLFADSSAGYIRDRIQDWLDETAMYPPRDDDSEYSFYIENAFPIADDRRQFFQRLLKGITPHVGYHLMCILAEEEIFQSVWTTNFDRLSMMAAKDHELTPVEIGLDSVDRIYRPIRRGELLEVALHGDYKYDSLKNTTKELVGQDPNLSVALSRYLVDHHLVVCGYSGRDESIMNTLLDAYRKSGSGRLYWCGYSQSPSFKVEELIEAARASGREAFYIGGVEFDELAIRLSRYCLTGDKAEAAKGYYEKHRELFGHTSKFSISFGKTNGVIKSNLFPIKLPREVLQFEIKYPSDGGYWEYLRNVQKQSGVISVPLKGKVLSFSTQTEILNAFPQLIGDIERTPILLHELRYQDSQIMHLLNSSLVAGISQVFKLKTNFRSTVWEISPEKTLMVLGVKVLVHKSTVIQIRVISGNAFFVIHPSYQLFLENGEEPSNEIQLEGRRVLLEKQRNKEYNDAVSFWRDKFFPEARTSGAIQREKLEFQFPVGSNNGFKFVLDHTPIFAEIDEKGRPGNAPINPKLSKLFQQKGIEIPEPTLVFSSLDGRREMHDPHPIRGLLQNRPYDFPITAANLLRSISVGVVCPESHRRPLLGFLQAQRSTIPVTTNQDYLLEYPGFQSAYGIPIDLPSENPSLVETVPTPDFGHDRLKIAIQILHSICERIEQLYNRERPMVIVVFIPSLWRQYTFFRNDRERFDLHDHIKAFCTLRGIATQLLEEKTIIDTRMQCQIHWWLSLSFYIKSLRTPWTLKGLETDTAYVGLGFGIDTTQQKGSILVGCSQIFNSRGEGMQYRLSKINDYTYRKGNPFLSKSEAYRLGGSIRQMFFESLNRIPARVVAHKRTPFSKEEKEGLIDGLGQIGNVDLIEMNFESSLRYVASQLERNGDYFSPKIDGFPVRRGTCLMLGDYEALLWSHGTSTSVRNPSYRFYKGGHRIPTPVRIIKHHGPSNIELLAKEILGLSKMNWNTMDLYAQLPITIFASNQIAKIGALLSRFQNKSYDYRYFI